MLSLTRVGLPKQFLRPSMVRGIKTIPQPPGHIVGTVNDAYVPPKADKKHGSYHWTSEKVVTIGMLPLIATSFASTPGVMVDTAMSAFILYHSYTGFQSCIIDYIPKRVYGPYHNFAMYLLTFGTGVAGYGIYSMEQKEEGGLARILSKIWNA
ncbi:CIC11C00000001542 [Sungouiella intermedia]|uniref:Succinate dehydrogenase [ubiquinone] cytochrome b small subunit n=1 Tax=Sungouiella intermedia TaxID=45354 RepID=A0A1L0D2E8_9ASCO|nr:CIC11C00000001542 [[Candida] intermedia]SGZ50636.1 CIC11C00000000127 [[Candida] intermedia]